jgi:putative DNA primase/helicase
MSGDGGTVTPIKSARNHSLRSRSYLSVVRILADNVRNVLDSRKLELNEMTGRIELGRKPITDAAVNQVRAEIEARFVVGQTKSGEDIGLQASISDVMAACDHVATQNAYHPVREYIHSLPVWDQIDRIESIPEDYLGAPNTGLNRAVMKKFFLSAVQRAMHPGCKVDTCLVLTGMQGVKKSTFFSAIADPWFLDTQVEIGSKDSFQQLRNAWIIEWSELESLRRAADINSAKAFLSSRVDSYRPAYGRCVVDVPRGCVIVATTNNAEFLIDDTGNRRFWPIAVGVDEIDVERLRRMRDFFWAEAYGRLCLGEEHWLDRDEMVALAIEQANYQARDPWDPQIAEWIIELQKGLELSQDPRVIVSSTQALRDAIKKPLHQCTRADEMRVAAIFRAHGAKRGSDRRKRTWEFPAPTEQP